MMEINAKISSFFAKNNGKLSVKIPREDGKASKKKSAFTGIYIRNNVILLDHILM